MRKTLPALYLLLGLLVGLSAASALAQTVSDTDSVAQVGYAEVNPGSSDASSPFVPEDAVKNSKDAPPRGKGSLPGLAIAGESDAQACDCGEGCQSCGGDCGDGHACLPDCDACPEPAMMFFAGLQSFRGVVDQDFQNNNGMVIGGNFGAPLPVLRDYGFGAQFGASFGAYNFNGHTGFNTDPETGGSGVQQQIFITAGIFHRATEKCPLNMGFGYDWMINDEYGVYATSPRLSQWRAQVGYAFNACNEFGVWAALNDHASVKSFAVPDSGLPLDVTYRPVSQVNLFWHHNYDCGGDTWLWLGMPENEKVGGDGRLGEFTLGLTGQVPLTCRTALYVETEYMKPTAHASGPGSKEYAYSIGFGLQFFPRGNAANRTVAGNCWMPVLPVANNGTFLVDSGSTSLATGQ